MCLTGLLAELLCCVAESVEESEQVVTVVDEIKQSISPADELKKIASRNGEVSNQNGDDDQFSQTDLKSVLIKEIVDAAIQANPTVSAIKISFGAVQDYRNGEEITDIIKDRTVQMVEDQIPNVITKPMEAELKNGIDKLIEKQ